MNKVTGVQINEMWDLSGNVPEGLIMWFNVLPEDKRQSVVEELKKML